MLRVAVNILCLVQACEGLRVAMQQSTTGFTLASSWGELCPPGQMVYSETECREVADTWETLGFSYAIGDDRFEVISEETQFNPGIPGCYYSGSARKVYSNTIDTASPSTVANIYMGICKDTDVPTSGTSGPHAEGDPHVTNMKGERFDLYREGKVPLLKLPADTAKYVKVDALAERRHQRTCKYDLYFSEMEVSGSWFNKTIKVTTEKTDNATGGFLFSVTVDGQPFTAKHAKMGKYGLNAFTLTKSSSLHAAKTPHYAGNQGWRSTEKVLIQAKNIAIEVKQRRGRRRPIAYLNIDIEGLHTLLKTMRIGGLLGEDDHTYWSDHKCNEKSFAKQRTDTTEEIITSSASAS